MRICTCLFLSLSLLLGVFCVQAKADDLKIERGKWEMILDNVSSEVQHYYYDPKLKGVDWKAKTEESRKRIRNAKDQNEMVTAILALTASLNDSHTVFLPPPRPALIKFGFDALAVGDHILVTSVRKGSAADKAGLQLGDELFTINGYNAKRATYFELMRYLTALRPATVMELQVIRAGVGKQITINADVEPRPQVTDWMHEYQWSDRHSDGSEEASKYHWSIDDDGIGYLELPSFTLENGMDWAAKRMKDAKAIILDVRSNGGGYQTYVLDLIGHFEKETTKVADVMERKGPRELKAKAMRPLLDVPLYVLIDSRSASAAELFAHHIQLRHKGTVIGDQSSGLLMSARIVPESFGIQIVTFYAISVSLGPVIFTDGDNLEGKGVRPDIFSIPTAKDVAENRDVTFRTALLEARKALKITTPKSPAEYNPSRVPVREY